MKRALAVLMFAAAVGAWVVGCGAGATKWDAEAAQYAAYATQVPLYPGTKIADMMGGESWGDTPDSYIYGMNWWCETQATREELIAFYEEKLPGAQRSTPYDDVIKLSVTPKGAQPGEEMGVLIEDGGKYRVFEERKTKEIRRS